MPDPHDRTAIAKEILLFSGNVSQNLKNIEFYPVFKSKGQKVLLVHEDISKWKFRIDQVHRKMIRKTKKKHSK